MKILTDIDLSPNLQKFLPLICEPLLFYKQYNLKHPSATYNLSLAEIDEALRDFLEIYKRYNENNFEAIEKENAGLLTKRYRDLLYCFREHLDDCLHIIKCFIAPPQNEKPNRNQYAWLYKNANNLVSEFFKNISEYKKYLDDILNELKHNNGILCCVAFYDSKGSNEHCLGYFVANVVNGTYQPVEKIHPKFGNVYTGFSHRRDLIYNLYNIYFLSEEMIIILRDKIGIDFNALKPKIVTVSDNKKEMFRDTMAMHRIHFPDEYLKPVPSLSITHEEKLKLEYPSALSIKPNTLNRVVINHATDGHTGSFKMLYM